MPGEVDSGGYIVESGGSGQGRGFNGQTVTDPPDRQPKEMLGLRGGVL